MMQPGVENQGTSFKLMSWKVIGKLGSEDEQLDFVFNRIALISL